MTAPRASQRAPRPRLGRRAPCARIALLGPLALAACLSVPDGPAPMCKRTSDCDQASGEVCQDNVCWGNPPPGPFAGVASPPSTRRDLVALELPQVVIPPDGLIDDIVLPSPSVLTGRIVAFCPPPLTGCSTTLASTITVSREAQFQGGPGFKATVDVDAGAESFSIPVPAPGSGGNYSLTIVPSSDPPSPSSGRAASELAPPLRLLLGAPDTTAVKTIVLGGAELPVISGALTNSLSQGLANYRVSAFGRWSAAEPPTEVSSVDFTDAMGSYAVTLSSGLVGTVELVARPPSGTIAPTIHLANVDATKSSRQDKTVASARFGSGAPIKIMVTGADLGGAISPIAGALVTVSGALADADGSAFYTLGDQQVTDTSGVALLNVLDGAEIASSFRMSIIPPASSTLGVVFDQAVTPSVRLASRVALRGVVVDATGVPQANATVTARPSLRFLWTLESAPQAFVAAIPAATAVTLETGEFVLWVDAAVAQVASDYDLVIEPPVTARAPTYVDAGVALQRDASDAVSLGAIVLPDAAFVHGRIVGPDAAPVENAELRLYLIASEALLCTQVAHAPSSCPIPAQIQGRNTSDAKGTFRLTLPR